MFNLKNIAAASALLAATLAAPLCGAQTVKVLTAGSSAQWGVFAEAARALALAEVSGTVANMHHCTINGPALVDHRGGSVPNEAGKIWIVWTTPGGSSVGDIWAYLSVDSVVGVRAFMAAPADTLSISSTTATCGNLLSAPSAALFPESDDTNLNSTVGTALQGHVLTAANTDVRPEDALFATNRAIAPLDTTSWNGLGIGTNGAVSDATSTAHVVPFALSGNDPVSGTAVGSFTTLPIGAAPIVFFASTSNTASGHLGDPTITLNINNGLQGTSSNDALTLFSGANCNAGLVGGSSSVAVTAALREPTSGTMNTTEFTNFRLSTAFNTSQEENATYPTMPSLSCTAGGGTRTRAIGTGNEVNAVKAGADRVGYAFYSFEALPNGTVAAPMTAIAYKYLKLNGNDPLFPASAANGIFPICGSNAAYFCEAPTAIIGRSTAYDSYDSLRSGNYDAWSVYRAVTTPSTSDATNMQQLIDVAQSVVDEALPDFVPLAPHCSGDSLTPASVTSGTISFANPSLGNVTTYQNDEPGLEVFRSHYNQSGFTAANGAVIGTTLSCSASGATWNAAFVGGTTEAGGDVGGSIINVGNAAPTPAQIGNTGSRQ